MKRTFPNIAKLVKNARTQNKQTQAELAQSLHIKAQALSSIERAVCSTPDSQVLNYAEKLGVSPLEIIEAKAKDYTTNLHNINLEQ